MSHDTGSGSIENWLSSFGDSSDEPAPYCAPPHRQPGRTIYGDPVAINPDDVAANTATVVIPPPAAGTPMPTAAPAAPVKVFRVPSPAALLAMYAADTQAVVPPPPAPETPTWTRQSVDPSVGQPPSPKKVQAEADKYMETKRLYQEKVTAENKKKAEEARAAAEARRRERDGWQSYAVDHAPVPQTLEEARKFRDSAIAIGQKVLVAHFRAHVNRFEFQEMQAARHERALAIKNGDVVITPSSGAFGGHESILDMSTPRQEVYIIPKQEAKYRRQPIQNRDDKRPLKRGKKQPTTSTRSKNQHLVHAWTVIVAGSVPAAIILAYVRYWSEPRSSEDSTDGPRTKYADAEHYWVRGSIREFADVTGLTMSQVRTALDLLLDEGLLIRRDPESPVDPEPRECLIRVIENMHDPEPEQRVQGLDVGRNHQYFRIDPEGIWRKFWAWIQIETQGGELPSSTPKAARKMYAACAPVGDQYETDAGGWYRSQAQTFFAQDAVAIPATDRFIHAVPLHEEWVKMPPALVRHYESVDELAVMLNTAGWRSLIGVEILPHRLAAFERANMLIEPLTPEEAEDAIADYRIRHAREDQLRTLRGSRSGTRRVSCRGKASQSATAPADGRVYDRDERKYVHYEPVYCPATGRMHNSIDNLAEEKQKLREQWSQHEQQFC